MKHYNTVSSMMIENINTCDCDLVITLNRNFKRSLVKAFHLALTPDISKETKPYKIRYDDIDQSSWREAAFFAEELEKKLSNLEENIQSYGDDILISPDEDGSYWSQRYLSRLLEQELPRYIKKMVDDPSCYISREKIDEGEGARV